MSDTSVRSIVPPYQSTTSASGKNREEEVLNTIGRGIQLQIKEDIQTDQLLHPTVCLLHPMTETQKQRFTSSPPSNRFSTSRHPSIQAWLDQMLPATESLTATQTSRQCDIRANRLKRKRSTSSDPGQFDYITPLTRIALKRHLALTMLWDESTSAGVYIMIHPC